MKTKLSKSKLDDPGIVESKLTLDTNEFRARIKELSRRNLNHSTNARGEILLVMPPNEILIYGF